MSVATEQSIWAARAAWGVGLGGGRAQTRLSRRRRTQGPTHPPTPACRPLLRTGAQGQQARVGLSVREGVQDREQAGGGGCSRARLAVILGHCYRAGRDRAPASPSGPQGIATQRWRRRDRAPHPGRCRAAAPQRGCLAPGHCGERGVGGHRAGAAVRSPSARGSWRRGLERGRERAHRGEGEVCALSMSWCQRVGGANERGWPLNFCDILGARNAKGGGGRRRAASRPLLPQLAASKLAVPRGPRSWGGRAELVAATPLTLDTLRLNVCLPGRTARPPAPTPLRAGRLGSPASCARARGGWGGDNGGMCMCGGTIGAVPCPTTTTHTHPPPTHTHAHPRRAKRQRTRVAQRTSSA